MTDQLTNIATTSTQVLTVRGLTALVIAMWTATTAMTSLIDALTVAYHETETRGFVRRTLLALTFVLGGALLLGGVIAFASIASRTFGDAPEPGRTVLHVVTWLALAALMSASLAVLYRFGPDRKNARWRWITLGAMGATASGWPPRWLCSPTCSASAPTGPSTAPWQGWRSACSGSGSPCC